MFNHCFLKKIKDICQKECEKIVFLQCFYPKAYV